MSRVLNPTRSASFVFTPTHHWGARTPFDKCKSLWGSWAVFGAEGNGRFWFGGDTAYCDVFAQIGEKLGPFDLAAIPIGNYRLVCVVGGLNVFLLLHPTLSCSPQSVMKWHHASPEEAVQIHIDLRSSRSLAIHWGTFKEIISCFPSLSPLNLFKLN